MHSYHHHIKDFNNDTRHLTRVERSLYRDAIELYYDTEQPLPADDFEYLARRLLAVSEEEKEALKAILHEYFEQTGSVWSHSRCDEEIEKYHATISAKARAGKASALARKEKAEQRRQARTNTDNQKQNTTETKLNTCSTRVHNQEPRTNNHKPIIKDISPNGDMSKPSVPPCPHQKIINLYHEVLPELQGVLIDRWAGSQRETDLRTRWREDKRHRNMDYWRWFFGVIRTNPHWMGENGWKPDLGWFLKRSNFDKVVQRGASL